MIEEVLKLNTSTIVEQLKEIAKEHPVGLSDLMSSYSNLRAKGYTGEEAIDYLRLPTPNQIAESLAHIGRSVGITANGLKENIKMSNKQIPNWNLNGLINELETELEQSENIIMLSVEMVEAIVGELRGKRSLCNRLNDDMVLPERQAVIRFGNEEVTLDIKTEDGKTLSVNQTWDGITIKRSDG